MKGFHKVPSRAVGVHHTRLPPAKTRDAQWYHGWLQERKNQAWRPIHGQKRVKLAPLPGKPLAWVKTIL